MIQPSHESAAIVLVQVPAVILVCRNSTDTAYFQRLRPYPRIMLLRYNTRFKDYVRPHLPHLHPQWQTCR